MTDPRFETIREARGKALNALNAGIPGSLDAFLHWENVADADLDSLAADLEAAREALARHGRHRGHCECVRWEPEDEFEPTCTCGFSAALARLSAGKETA